MIDMKLDFRLAGRFKLEAFKTDAEGNEIPGTRRVAADWFSNLITNNGLDLIGTGSGFGGAYSGVWLFACGVGSGSTTPAFTDTALVAQVARSSARIADVAGAQGTAPYFGWRRITYRFGTGVAAGNLSEVGIFSTADTGGICCSRALIVDGGGTPTTITVLSDETLDVTYELRLYPNTSDVPWSAAISGVSYSGVARACNVTTATYGGFWAPGYEWGEATAGVLINTAAGGAYCYAFATQTLGAITSQPDGAGYAPGRLTATAYTNGTYTRSHTLTWELSQGNTGSGIGSLRVCSIVGTYQLSITPVIPKDATKKLTLNVTMSWGRYTP